MDNNVKLNFKKKRNITKKLGDQSFKIKPFISIDEKEYILNAICGSLTERMEEKEEITPLILGIQADLDMLICILCTNVNLEGVKYEDIYNSEFLSIVKENIVNYKDIEKSCTDLVYFLKIINSLPDISGLSENFDIKKLMEGKSPEEIEELTNIINNLNKSKE